MRWLALILLVGVFLRHGAANSLAGSFGLSAAAWFYILGGLWEVTMCALIAWLVVGYRETIWRWLVLAGCAIGALEGAQVAVCRLAVTDIRAVPTGVNLCDHVTGLPIGSVMFTLYILAVSYAIGRIFNKG